MSRDFKKIKAWEYADELAVLVYEKIKDFPKEEIYGVTSQLRRAAVSVLTNIAGGAGKERKKEYLNFLNIARGSIVESEYLLHFSKRLGYLNESEYEAIDSAREETAKTLYGLMMAVKKDSMS